MYFVLVRQPGYALFAMTPDECGAVALVEDQKTVRLLQRPQIGASWESFAEWPVDELTHTDLMAAMQDRDAPTDPKELLGLLPSELRDKIGS